MGGFPIISLFYLAIGAKVIWQIIQQWSSLWDRRFTNNDRMLVSQSAFFLLIPISVALHEFGHAIAIWAFGREVLDFGFYVFAGWVSYNPMGMTDLQQTIISAAGTIVNLILCLIALAIVFLKKPPLRAAFNELLIQFAILSGANAFIFYPLLDLLSGMNGDWRQMYDSGVPWLSGLIIAVQFAVIAAGWWIVKHPPMQQRINSLTAVPRGFNRGPLGGLNPAEPPQKQLNPGDITVRDAVDRVVRGWQGHVDTQRQSFEQGSAHLLIWQSNGAPRAVGVRTFANGAADILAIPVSATNAAPTGQPRIVQRWNAIPSADALTLALRIAMEQVDQAN